MSNRSWVTLATNDSYGLGALVLAHSLRRAGSVYPAVVLITPSVTEAMRERLRAVFAEVVTVDVLDSRDAAHLALLQRPELGITFTKIHCWNLTQYEKCVFLDADILVVQNCDELFEREELSAAPDVGWPDCFNSGVFVFKPSAETFENLIKFAQERGSFDGGDQGLLNSFFSDWAHGDINKHLPFLYNVTSAAFYSYLPALKHYGQNLKIIHFIGAAKPWLQQFNWESRHVDAPEHLREFLQLWWDLFVSQVHSHLDVSMSGVAGNLARVALGGGHEAIDDLTRRQGWEAGNIDYMGVDAFENIWAKISQTLSQPRSSPPKQSPPREPAPAASQPSVVSEKPMSEEIEVAKEALPVEAPVVPAEVPAPVEAPVVVPTEIEAPVVPAEVAAPVEEVVTSKTTAPSEVVAPVEAPAAVSTQVVSDVSSPVAVPDVVPVVVKAAEPAPVAAEAPVAPEPAADSKPAAQEVPAPVEAAAPIEIPESEVPVPVEAIDQISVPKEAEPEVKKTEAPEIKSSPAEAAVEAPKCVKPVEATPASPAPAEAAGSPAVPEATPEKVQAADVSTDSPPLANTPSKEEAPAVPAAKSTEEAAQETRL
ncbi:hypothetical protein O3G_MSEX004575 [Manduca sexta]|uniref:glycogenin glucosyltransferase n=1 Tax=Manduca sexta TaxID=7130 RepID=A0A922CID8_MANSE|nr:hypothetical protein O3G_MSEX004575 [Manduca sexta]KAG6446733.1 hypothetical protein O3G_MSEX004575 [Manduca sexta]KAG6446734.1 hypothetical protein O3G_MSEX004575 [Manduca sexta]